MERNISKSYSKFLKSTFFIYVFVVVYFSISPTPPFNYNQFLNEDKLWHFFVYMIGSIILYFAFLRNTKGKLSKLVYFSFFLFFLIFPILDEIYQENLPYRDGNFFDAFFSIIGFLSGAILSIIFSTAIDRAYKKRKGA